MKHKFTTLKEKTIRNAHLKPRGSQKVLNSMGLFILAHYEKAPVNKLLIDCDFSLEYFDEFIIKYDKQHMLICVKKEEDGFYYVNGIAGKSAIHR